MKHPTAGMPHKAPVRAWSSQESQSKEPQGPHRLFCPAQARRRHDGRSRSACDRQAPMDISSAHVRRLEKTTPHPQIAMRKHVETSARRQHRQKPIPRPSNARPRPRNAGGVGVGQRPAIGAIMRHHKGRGMKKAGRDPPDRPTLREGIRLCWVQSSHARPCAANEQIAVAVDSAKQRSAETGHWQQGADDPPVCGSRNQQAARGGKFDRGTRVGVPEWTYARDAPRFRSPE